MGIPLGSAPISNLELMDYFLGTKDDTTRRIATSELKPFLESLDYCLDTGVANAYVLTPLVPISNYVVGQVYKFKSKNTNTGASTVNISGIGVKNLVKSGNVALAPGDIPKDAIINAIFDGTNFQITPDYNAQLLDITQKSTLAENSNILTVGKKGCRFALINDAINYAKVYATQTNRVTILIASGLYDEELILQENNSIDLVGAGKGATIVKHNSVYPNAPIFVMGNCTISNITFYSSGGTNSYALHYEIGGTTITGKTRFNDCEFISDTSPAIGCGIGADCTLEFYNCIMNNIGSEYSIYLHNNPFSNKLNQKIKLYNCAFYGKKDGQSIAIDDSCSIYSNTNSKLELTFANCTAEGTVRYRKTETTLYTYIPSVDTNITLSNNSKSEILGLNYEKREIVINTIVFKPPNVVPTTKFYDYSVALNNADQYNVAISNVTASGIGDITSSVTITSVNKNCINLKDVATTGAGYTLAVSLLCTAK